MKGKPGEKKNFRDKTASYSIIDRQLHYNYKRAQKVKNGPEHLRVIKSNAERKRLLKGVHEGLGSTLEAAAIGGHFGRDKTLWKLIDMGVWWPQMNADVREFVKTCPACQKAAARLDKAAPELHPVPVPTKVWYQVGVDLTGMPACEEG